MIKQWASALQFVQLFMEIFDEADILFSLFHSHISLASPWNNDLCVQIHEYGEETFQTRQKGLKEGVLVSQMGMSPAAQHCYHTHCSISFDFACSL